MLDQLSDTLILKLASEAARGGEELETARNLLRHEMSRRSLYMAYSDNTGVVDALADDTSTNPIHLLDDLWQQPETD